MSFIRPNLIKMTLGGLIVAISPSISLADGYGLFHPFHHNSYVMKSTTVGTPVVTGTPVMIHSMAGTTGVATGASGVLVPTPTTTTTTSGTSILVNHATAPMGLMPASFGPVQTPGSYGHVPIHYLMPMSYTTAAMPVSAPATTTASLFTNTTASTPASLLSTASVPSGNDFRTEYANFVNREMTTSPAGVMISGDDFNTLRTTHAPLANAVGGVPRLVSLARFLKTKLDDPNFRAKAIDLLGSIAGTAFPEATPAINIFLEQLGHKPVVTPGPAPTINPANLVGSFEGKVGSDGTMSGRFVPSTPPVPAPAPSPNPPPVPVPPAPVAVDPLTTIESVARALGATIVSKDVTGMVIKKVDGNTVKFGADGIPIP